MGTGSGDCKADSITNRINHLRIKHPLSRHIAQVFWLIRRCEGHRIDPPLPATNQAAFDFVLFLAVIALQIGRQPAAFGAGHVITPARGAWPVIGRAP